MLFFLGRSYQLIFHVANLDKFIPPYIDFIDRNFEKSEHKFWLSGSARKNYSIVPAKNIFIATRRGLGSLNAYWHLLVGMHKADQIILHALFMSRVIFFLFCCPWLLPKCYWLIWGSDLYQYNNPARGLSSRRKEFYRRFVIKRIGHLVTYIAGDIELARKWYGAKGQYHECLMYLSNIVDPEIISDRGPRSNDGTLRILVGNSSDPSNNHEEVFEKLLPYKNDDIAIYVPLSYGNKVNANKIADLGKRWFGDKFIPMVEFMPYQDYLDFLRDIDIAVFNHKRQQAMGNTISLLGLGKTVFMRSDVSQWQFLTDMDLKVGKFEDLKLERMPETELRKNAHIVRSNFSESILVRQWSAIFGE